MKVRLERHGDVERLWMQSTSGRLAGVSVSVYVVRGVLIDTGFHRAEHEVLEAATARGITGAIVTHWHEDHAGNVAALAAQGVPIAMREDTEEILRRHPAIQLYRRLIWGRPPAVVAPISAFESAGLEGIHTPGHSPDHQVIWDSETGTLFSGDLWLGVRARVLHVAEDPRAIVTSLRRAASLSPARMFDAHRGLVEKPASALTAKAEWMTETIEMIEREIAVGRSDREIVKFVLGGEEAAALVSRGEYARVNFVRAVRRSMR